MKFMKFIQTFFTLALSLFFIHQVEAKCEFHDAPGPCHGYACCNSESGSDNGSSASNGSSAYSDGGRSGLSNAKRAAIGAAAGAVLGNILLGPRTSQAEYDRAANREIMERRMERQKKEEEERIRNAANKVKEVNFFEDPLFIQAFSENHGIEARENDADRSLKSAMQNCPYDAAELSSLMTNEGKYGAEQSIIDLIEKGGGAANAMALLAAQKTKYQQTMLEAEKSAKDSYGGQGSGANFGDPLAYNCPESNGIYCSANHLYWLSKDGLTLTDFQIKALGCYMQNGVI